VGPCPDANEISIDKIGAGSGDLPVVPIGRSQFACDVGQITGTFPASRARNEGRFAIVTKRWAWDAVDAFGARDECA
jgi:hypothetical protein